MPNIQADPEYDPEAIFRQDGPIDPWFMADAIQALMRAHPLDTPESEDAQQRHLQSALIALASTNPRDAIEVMLAVQALCAYQAAIANWRLGMNLCSPSGVSTRHITAAATAARTFDTMLRAMERRQAKPLAVPVGRPAPKVWSRTKAGTTLGSIADRIHPTDNGKRPGEPSRPRVVWSADDLTFADQMMEKERIEGDNEGLDLAHTRGILPGGGMILTEAPTPQQAAYMGRRLGLRYKREYAENLKQGLHTLPKIRPIRPGDLIP
jgi:hypothetical protein